MRALLISLAAVLILPAHVMAAESAAVDANKYWWKYFVMKERDKVTYPDKVIRLLNIRPGSVVVDVDPGPGYWTFRLARAAGPNGRVYGVQVCPLVNEEMDEFVSKKLSDRRQNPYNNVQFLKRPQEDIGFEPDSVDMAFLCLCGFLLGDPADRPWSYTRAFHDIDFASDSRLLQSIYRALKPGGRLVVIDILDTPVVMGYQDDAGYRLLHRAKSEEIVKENYGKLGFRPVEQFDIYKGKQYIRETEIFSRYGFYGKMPPSEKPSFVSEKFFLVFEKPFDGTTRPVSPSGETDSR